MPSTYVRRITYSDFCRRNLNSILITIIAKQYHMQKVYYISYPIIDHIVEKYVAACQNTHAHLR